MDLKELMETSPQDLAALQYKELKAHILRVLDKVHQTISKDNLGKIEALTEFSPAGDECGTDHHFINFWYANEPLDIVEITMELMNLRDTIYQGRCPAERGEHDDD